MRSKIFEKYSVIFWLFMTGSMLGFVHENILTFLKGQFVIRRGLIYEPLIPIYGIGLLVFYLAYCNLDFKKSSKAFRILKVFLIGFLIGGFIEYICSLVQEVFFGTISWDYTYLKYNFNGRTSIFHASCWGILGIIFYEYLLPILKRGATYITDKPVKIITIVCSIILIFDCCISFFACERQTERRNLVEPKNSFDIFLDYYYPDYFLDNIYNNAKTVR